MGNSWKKLAWIWVWRRVGLGLAPCRCGFGAAPVWDRRDHANSQRHRSRPRLANSPGAFRHPQALCAIWKAFMPNSRREPTANAISARFFVRNYGNYGDTCIFPASPLRNLAAAGCGSARRSTLRKCAARTPPPCRVRGSAAPHSSCIACLLSRPLRRDRTCA
jgi:hypothetical protein